MIQLSAAGKRYGHKLLFEGADWLITNHDRVGLVGANGTGKSTLLKILAEMETLDSALAEMSDCKNAMSCKECDGEGCKACQGNGEKFSDQWMRSDFGRGGGVGAGARPETKNDTEMYDSQVKPNVGKGASVVAGQADGPTRRDLMSVAATLAAVPALAASSARPGP